MKKIFVPLMLSLACALVLTACGGSGSNNSNASAGSGDKIGVAECDDYLAKMQACLTKLPAQAKQTWDSSYQQYKDQWRKAASTAEGRAQLAQGCKTAMESAKALKSLGCDF